jgi:hypothetical protein
MQVAVVVLDKARRSCAHTSLIAPKAISLDCEIVSGRTLHQIRYTIRMTTLTATGLTEKVLGYKPPHPAVAEQDLPQDRAAFADPQKQSLLSAASKARNLTPYIGTELLGVQLSQLTPEQKDELALLAAEVSLPRL